MSRKRKQMAVAEICISATVGCWQWRRFSVCQKQEASTGFWWAAHKEQCLRIDLNFVALITKTRTILFYKNGDHRSVLKTSKKMSRNFTVLLFRINFSRSCKYTKGNHMIYLTLPIK